MKANDLQEFISSSVQGLGSIELKALWWDAKGDWQKAHDLVDGPPTQTAARVHAYLHRKEGDIWNADYWYRRAGEPRPDISLEEEWEKLVVRFSKP